MVKVSEEKLRELFEAAEEIEGSVPLERRRRLELAVEDLKFELALKRGEDD